MVIYKNGKYITKPTINSILRPLRKTKKLRVLAIGLLGIRAEPGAAPRGPHIMANVMTEPFPQFQCLIPFEIS